MFYPISQCKIPKSIKNQKDNQKLMLSVDISSFVKLPVPVKVKRRELTLFSPRNNNNDNDNDNDTRTKIFHLQAR